MTDTLDCASVIDLIKSRRGERRQILLVPDRFMLYYEKAVMERLAVSACFDVEVVSFARLASKILGLTGENFLSPQGAVMLLRKVIEEQKDKLVCFRASYGNVNFASEVYAVISQIRNSGISTSMIEDAIAALPTKVVNKSKDILLLYRGYVDALRDGLIDGTSKLAALVEAIERNGLEDADVYVSDYLYFSGTERDVLEAIFKRAHSTSVFFAGASEGAENARIYPTSCLNSLIDRARQAGCMVKMHASDHGLKGDKKVIKEQLFSYNGFVAPSDGFVRLWSSPTIEDEVMRVAREIRRKVTDGARYRDFAVVCCDAESYLPVITRVFARCGIACFADRKRRLSVQAAPRLVLSAMRAVAKNFRRREIVEFCRSGILGLDCTAVDVFENYMVKYGIDGFSPVKPFAAGGDIDPDRAVADAVRAEIAAYLQPIRDDEATVAEFAERIDEFMKGCDFDAKVETYAQKLTALDDPAELSCLKQGVEKFKDLIDQSVRLMGGCRMTLSEYHNILAGAAAGESISMIPLSADSVFVGESRESRYDNVKYMYVVGAVAGKLPPEHGEGGIFATKESREWSKAGLDVEPDTAAQNDSERLNTLMFMLKPTERLTVSYPQYAGDGSANAPSALMGQISEMLGVSVDAQRSVPPESADGYAYLFADEAGALKELLLYKARLARGGAIDGTGAYDALYAIACEREGKTKVDLMLSAGRVKRNLDTSAAGVEPWRGGYTSVSRFEKYFDCPFKYYMDYVLGVRRRDEAKMQSDETGTIIHDVLERYFRDSDYDPGDRAAIAARANRCIDAALSEPEHRRLSEIPELRGAVAELRGRCVFLIVTLVERMRSSGFKPYELERAFGFDDKTPPIVIDAGGKKLKIRGVIDRVDRCGDDVIVLDYKSAGTVEFSLPQIYFGERIQLPIYMRAIAEAENLTPVGMFYLPMKNVYVKDDSDATRFRYVGFINTDGKIPEELDVGFKRDEHVGDLFPLVKSVSAPDKEGEIHHVYKGADGQGAVVDTVTFAKICDYAYELVRKAAAEIDGGFILPVGRNCGYCDYSHICNKARADAERTTSKAKSFDRYKYFAPRREGKE